MFQTQQSPGVPPILAVVPEGISDALAVSFQRAIGIFGLPVVDTLSVIKPLAMDIRKTMLDFIVTPNFEEILLREMVAHNKAILYYLLDTFKASSTCSLTTSQIKEADGLLATLVVNHLNITDDAVIKLVMSNRLVLWLSLIYLFGIPTLRGVMSEAE